MRLTIEKTIISTKHPEFTNVFWLDVSTEEEILKVFNNGKWIPIKAETTVEPFKNMEAEYDNGYLTITWEDL